MKYNCKVVAIVIVTIFFSLIGFSYEDITHQRLTDQAVKIAVAKGGVPQSFYEHYSQAIINGAGAQKWYGRHAGEDYTKYWISKRHCKLKVHPYRFRAEPLNHFHNWRLGKPAIVKCRQFYRDAVRVWLHGDKEQAAFILGRALHLIEDMAQPHRSAACGERGDGDYAYGVTGRLGAEGILEKTF